MQTHSPLPYWYGVPADRSSAERYQEVADAGFNIAQIGGSREQVHKTLGHCVEAGIKAMVMDGRMPRAGHLEGNGWKEAIAALVTDYGKHPALWGYYVVDEPCATDFADLGKIIAEIERQDPKHPGYINLFPNYADEEQLGAATYDEHLARYIAEVKPPLVSYDHYCLMEDGARRTGYYPNLAAVRRRSMEAGLDFWQIILSSALLEYRDPTEADMRWQVWTSLAYGAKGISYFTYWTVPSDNFRTAIIDPFGERTHHYYDIQRINRELANVGPMLLSMTSLGVTSGPGVAAHTDHFTPKFVVEQPSDTVVVGEFDLPEHAGALIVVNDDVHRSRNTRLVFAPEVSQAAIVNRVTGKPGQRIGLKPCDAGNEGWFWLSPGDGVLIVLD